VAVTVVIGACQGCGACLLTCPEHALRPAPVRPWVDTGRCTGCGECAEVCPVDAIAIHPAGAAAGGGGGR
jgi:Pyruvate/2-oxoacid:ferredoxin oxidoreductase delta subunit